MWSVNVVHGLTDGVRVDKMTYFQIDAYSFGEQALPTGGDVTALGWAQLISLYAAREREVARSAAVVAAAAVVDNAAAMPAACLGLHMGNKKTPSHDGPPTETDETRKQDTSDGACGARGGAVGTEAQAVAAPLGKDMVEGTKVQGEAREEGIGGAGSDEQSHPLARVEL